MIISSGQEDLHEALNTISFSEAVERHLREHKFESYLSAIVDLANELDLDEKAIAKLLSDTLKEKIRLEAEEDGLMFRKEKPAFVFE